jgi:hypothetical protein
MQMLRSLNVGTPSRFSVLPERLRRPAFLDILALLVCLGGFVALVSMMWTLKTGGRVPRLAYLLALAMTFAPFVVAILRRPKPLFLIPPVIALFLIYPVATPYGIVWSPDPTFNYNFTQSVVASGFWVPGKTETFEPAYAYYPVGNVFMGYIILTAHLPGAAAFVWLEPIIRMLAIPATVYSIARRRFSAQTSTLGLFFYLGTGSILFNAPVQQGMGTIFFALALLSLLMMSQSPNKSSQRRVLILFMISSGTIVLTHHLTSYVFAGWIAGLALLMAGRPTRMNVASLRLPLLTGYFVALLGLYVATFTYPIFVIHERSLSGVLERLASPEILASAPTGGVTGPALGRTYETWEIAWIGSSILGLFTLAVFSILKYRRARIIPFATANGLVAAALVFVTLPLLATAAHDIPLRVGEYTNLFIAPFAAATLIRWSQSRLVQLEKFVPQALHPKRWTAAGAVLLAALLFMGGAMVPGTNRVYFEARDQFSSDTVFLGGPDGARASTWASEHFGEARIWGDQLAIDFFVGFAPMRVDYGSSLIFVNQSFNATTWSKLAVGDYVVVNHWMVIYTPHFLREPEGAPPAPIPVAAVEKFARDPHFTLVFEDATWSVYRVIAKPP